MASAAVRIDVAADDAFAPEPMAGGSALGQSLACALRDQAPLVLREGRARIKAIISSSAVVGSPIDDQHSKRF